MAGGDSDQLDLGFGADAVAGAETGADGAEPIGQAFVGRGARAVEARLVREVAAWRDAVRRQPRLLARPLVVVVPSRSLRDHVSAVLVREVGALAGVAVQTHHTTALQVLERAGVAPPPGSEWVPVFVQRAARRARGLAALDGLTDGYGAVSAAVSDLLDAGLDETTAPAVRDFWAEPEPERGRRLEARAEAVCDVALAVRAELQKRGLGRLADVIRLARVAVEAEPDRFAAGRVVLHGFADATGLVTDFLRALLAGRPSLVLLDRPPDPADPERPDLGTAFSERFEQRVAPWAAAAAAAGEDAAPPPRIDTLRAPGTDAEVRAVAAQLLARRECDGVPWEAMAVVTRTPALYAPAVRVQFGRLGIPFSGVGVAGPRSAAGRRAAFLLDWLRRGERLPADRFVHALGGLGLTQRDDLRLGLHALGVARLGDLASLDVDEVLGERDHFPLPVRRGLDVSSAVEEGATADPFAARRALGRAVLEEGRDRARRAMAALERADDALPLAARLAGIVEAVEGGLGWGRDEDTGRLLAIVRSLGDPLPADEAIRLDELLPVLDRAFARAAHGEVGGAGGGVQLLDVVEARARTFEHLFVVGLNRDQFPRVVSDDPLLPDALRRPLQALLPELPVKERGHDEERFLFAQLVSSSPVVTLSWQVLGDDGKAKAPSPLVDRLLGPREAVALVPTLLAPGAPLRDEPALDRPAHEWALLAGLHGTRSLARGLIAPALAEVVGASDGAVVEARGRVLDEVEARRVDAWLGPYFGQVGRVQETRDLRRADPWVTTVEAIARCPWQAFLTRMLRLERSPDALEALPGVSALLLGRVVHDVLERVVTDVIPDARSAERLTAGMPTPVPWPDAATLRAWAHEVARRLLLEEGIGVRGFDEILAARAWPYLEEARRLDWADGPVPVVGVEVEAAARVEAPGGPHTVRFRADRVDRGPDGLRLSDYKTGRAKAGGVDMATGDRREKFRQTIRAGAWLQAAAYARAASGAEGRFLFLRPDVDERARAFAVRTGDEDLQDAFAAAVGRVAGANEQGTFVPRLVDRRSGEEPAACQWCEVSLACVRGDSGARRRVTEWSDAGVASDDPGARALRGVWRIGEDGDD